VIVLIILLLLVGQIPDLRKADCILFSVKALLNALLNIGQNKLLVIATSPAVVFINWSSSTE
jgi:hypothetical protein